MSRSLPDPISEILSVGYTDYSDSTLRVYRAAWRDFLKHTGPAGKMGGQEPDGREEKELPPPIAVAGYLDDRRDLAWSTLTSRRQAIRLVYQELSGEDPFELPEVQELWTDIRKRKQEEPDRAPKRSVKERDHSFAEIIEEGPQLLSQHLGGISGGEKESLRYLPEQIPRPEDLLLDQRELIPEPTYDLQVLRNRALLLVMGTAGPTRAGLVGIDLEDIYPPADEEGATRVLLYDQTGEPNGVLRLESAPEIEYCPHRALAAWILAADLEKGPLFRSFTPHGNVSESRIRPQTINHVIKRCAEEAGLDSAEWSTRELQRT